MPLKRIDDFHVLDTDTGIVSYIPKPISPGAPVSGSGPAQAGDELMYPTGPQLSQLPEGAPPPTPTSPPLSTAPEGAPPPHIAPSLTQETQERYIASHQGGAPAQESPAGGVPNASDTLGPNVYQGMADDSAAVLEQQRVAGEAKLAAEGAAAQTSADYAERAAAGSRDYQVRRAAADQAAQLRADKRWDTFQRELNLASSQKIDPGNFWNSRANWQKAVGVLSIALGSLGKSTGGRNVGLEIINQYIRDDIAAQKDNIANRFTGLKFKEAANERADARDLRGLEEMGRDHLLRLDSLQKELNARLGYIDANSGQAARMAQFSADLAASGLDQANAIRGFLIEDERRVADREFQREMQNDAQRHSAWLASMDREERRAAAEREAKAKEGGAPWDPNTALSTDNFVVVDETTGQTVELGPAGVPFTDKVPRNLVAEKTAAAQTVSDTMGAFLHQLNKEPGFWDDVLGEQERQAALQRAVQAGVQANEKGAASDQDKDRFEQIIRGYSGTWFKERIKPGDAKKVVEEAIRAEARKADTIVNNYKDPRMTGKRISVRIRPYKPAEDAAEGTNEEEIAEVIGKAGGQDRRPALPEATKKIQERTKAESSGDAKDAYDKIEAAAREGDLETLETLSKGLKGAKKFEAYTPTGQPGDRINLSRRAKLHKVKLEAEDAIRRATDGMTIRYGADVDEKQVEFQGRLMKLRDLRKLVRDTQTGLYGGDAVDKTETEDKPTPRKFKPVFQ